MAEPITFLDKDILVNGVSTQMVAGTLKASGLAEHNIGEILGYWMVGATGNSRPQPFDFSTDVQTTDPAMDITYTRGFVHTDWVDGEDRVQASSTPEELGFNARFHAIENEFDAIRAQFVQLSDGGKELRSDLVGVVRELESKITALQDDLFDLRAQVNAADTPTKRRPFDDMGILGTVQLGDKSAYIAQTGNDFQLIEFAGSTLAQTLKVPPRLTNPIVLFDPQHARPDQVVNVVAGLEDLMGSPSVKEVVERPGATIADLRSVVGGATLPTGESAASILASLPADQALSGVPGTVSMLTDHVVGQLSQATRDAVLTEAVVDPNAQGAAVGTLGGESAEVVGLSAGMVGALQGAGVDTTVTGLSRMSSANLSATLSGAGLNLNDDLLRDAVARTRIIGAIAAHH
jgi:hypothetical protein